MELLKIRIPWPKKRSAKIFPIFLPNWGCPGRCVFCSQEAQTGKRATSGDLDGILINCREAISRRGEMVELAFYGGTFTAIPAKARRKCLDFARAMRDAGMISGFRCSTRPDKISEERARELIGAGCGLIEFGVQSFNDGVLALSRRGCSGDAGRAALELCSGYGLAAGVHLMPGLPGSSAQIFLDDVRAALELGANFLRLHPCLVLRGTDLERLWRRGEYAPMEMEETLEVLAQALCLATVKDVPVIRIGVAPEPDFEGAVLAGPRCPSLGSRVQGLAMLMAVEKASGEAGA
ncbi:MAG: radical SAM protein, partial [Desulfovibrio sp.]|nr:radical SAM protein [Desulfovibrio sp.]